MSARILRLAGIEERTAKALGFAFAAPAPIYERRIGRRELLVLHFVKIGAADWELTPESRDTWRQPFHPRVRLSPTPARGRYERCENLGEFAFDSGQVAPGLRCTLDFREHRFALTVSSDLLRDDWSFADRIDGALSVIPAAHLARVREIVLDPGEHPTRDVAATASGTRINMFLSGAGKGVPQDTLDETTAHEVGHVVSSREDRNFWARWGEASPRTGSSRRCTRRPPCAKIFAETYVRYLGDPAARARLPRRFAILDRLFDFDCEETASCR